VREAKGFSWVLVLQLVPYCVACSILKRTIELEYAEPDNVRKLAVLRELLESANLYIGPDIETVVFATVLHRRLKTLLGREDIYKPFIEAMLDRAVSRARSIEESLSDASREEKASKAMLIAALATGYRPLGTPDKLLEEPPSTVDLTVAGSLRTGRDDTGKVLEHLKSLSERGGTVYYLFASVFELPYDAILIRILREDYGLDVIGVVRSQRYEDYVVAGDIDALGLGDILSDVINYGSDAATVIRDEHEHVFEQLNKASLVVVKGGFQSLYFHNNPLDAPTLMLFASSCPVISQAFNVPKRSINIIFSSGQSGQE
jgi:uncharacterized protein with ATP-grasp and redox domains